MGPLQMLGGPNFGDALTRHCPTRFQKHAENTIYLQCLNRFNGKDADVLGKQVLMLNEKKISKYTFNHYTHCYAHTPLANLSRTAFTRIWPILRAPPTNSFLELKWPSPPPTKATLLNSF